MIPAVLCQEQSEGKISGADWIQAMCAHNQYSSMSVIGDSQSIVYGDAPRSPYSKNVPQTHAESRNDLCSDRTEPDITDGSLYASVTSGWFKTEYSREARRTSQSCHNGKGQTFFRIAKTLTV